MNSSPNKSERRFHDAWAFYLYVFLYIVLSTVFIINMAPMSTVSSSFEGLKLKEVLLYNTVFLLAMLAGILLMCYFMPKFMIYLSIIMLPAISIASFIRSPEKKITGVILGIFNIIILLFVVLMIIRHIDYISKMLSTAARIFFSNIFGVLLVFSITNALLIIQLIPAMMADATNDIIRYLRYATVLLVFWTIFISYYFNHVYMASVVFTTISGEGSVFTTSISNSFYALGSISYGALLLALIATLQTILSDAEAANKRSGERGGSLLRSIMISISQFILDILGSIVKFANVLAFPYLSVHGTGYEESVSNSFQLITSSDLGPLASFSGVNFVVGFVSLVFLASSGYMNLELFDKEGLSLDNIDNIVYIVLVIAFFNAMFNNIFFLLKSAVLAVVFTAISAPQAVAEFDPELSDVLNQKKNEMVHKESQNK